jgi:ferredoxin
VDLFLSIWPLTLVMKKISRYPPFKQLFAPALNRRIFQVTFVPVSEEIPGPESTVLPRQAIAELVKASSHRFIHNGCICRTRMKCKNYPADLGCLFLGEAASRLHPSIGHQAGVEECLEHVDRMTKLGLTGMIGRMWMDATALGVVHDFRNFVVICFCCDCCCLVRAGMKDVPPELRKGIYRLQAVKVTVTDECKGCGTCVDNCFVAASSLREGKAYIDPDLCKGCGRCAMLCPNQAIRVAFDEGDALWQELLTRVKPAIKPANP